MIEFKRLIRIEFQLLPCMFVYTSIFIQVICCHLHLCTLFQFPIPHHLENPRKQFLIPFYQSNVFSLNNGRATSVREKRKWRNIQDEKAQKRSKKNSHESYHFWLERDNCSIATATTPAEKPKNVFFSTPHSLVLVGCTHKKISEPRNHEC